MRNMQTLAIEMFKVADGISPEIMKEVFNFRGKKLPTAKYFQKTIS